MIFTGDAGADPCTDGVVVRFGAGEFEADPVILESLVVAKEEWFAAGLGEDDVEVAVAIDISVGGTAAGDGSEDFIASVR